MKILDFFYEEELDFKNAIERKQEINSKNLIIKGARHSGKRSLLLSYFKNFDKKEILFLNFKDLRFKEDSLLFLDDFLKNKIIKIIIFYGVNENFTFNFSNLIDSYQIIICTEFASVKIDFFEEIWLDFLDFEEFLSLSKKNPQLGTYFQIGRCLKNEQNGFLNDYLSNSFSNLELEILKYVALNLGLEFSINELYTRLKKNMKLSKDGIYKAVSELENRYILHFVKHSDKALKKVYFSDFAFKNALCLQKDFKKLFANAILCELFKFKEEIFYNKHFDFVLKDKKIAFIAADFFDVDLLVLKAKKLVYKALELGIFHIIFISLSNETIFYEEGVKVEVLPFENWALSL